MRALLRTATVVATTIVVLAAATAAHAASPPVTVKIEPTAPATNTAVVERVPFGPGVTDQYLLNASVLIHNDSGYYVTIAGVSVKYGEQTVGVADTLTIYPNTTIRVRMPTSLRGDVPIPTSGVVRVVGEGYSDPILQGFSAREMQSEVPGGAYYLPFHAAPANTQWVNFESQTEQSHHYEDPAQQYAYDLLIKRYDTKKGWVSTKVGTSGTQLTNYLAYGQKVYAMASGTVIECRRSLPDNKIGQTDSKRRFGNTLWVRTADDEVVAYAHLQPGSIPASLCPQESVPGTDSTAPVHALPRHVQLGQQIGLVGNTGNTSEPHTHIQLDRNAPWDVDDQGGDAAPGLPLEFHRFEAGPNRYSALTAKPAMTAVGDDGAAAITPFGLFKPNSPCGVITVAPGAPEAALVGHASACLNEHISDLQRQGYYVTNIDAGALPKSTAFDVIARPDQPETVAAIGLTAQQLSDQEHALAQQDPNWRYADVDTYTVGTDVRFAAVFVKTEGAFQELYKALDAADLKQVLADNAPDGIVPVKVSTIGRSSGPQYAVLLEQRYSGSFGAGDYIVEDTAVGSFQTQFNKRVKAGLRLQAIEGYNAKTVSGTPTITAIWAPLGDPNWFAKHNLTSTAWATQWGTELKAGYFTHSFSPFNSGGTAHHASLWLGPF